MRRSMAGSPCMLCLLASAAMLPLAGCGASGSGVAQFKVHGEVLSHGKPATGAIVVLHPVNKTGAASPYPRRGVVEKDGTFAVGSRTTDDGAPEGDYAVTIVWPAEGDPKKQFDNPPPDRLKNRYNDLKHAKWTVHVTAGTNTLEAFNVE